MGKIKILDDRLANMIAAGEVVERPSSVVKELVENAIDASADKIEIVIEEGGLSSIKVSDNGHGIERDECRLAFERHATSKIQKERDLFHIQTLGFRGEALPSIAAVSRLELKSKTRESDSGTRILIEGGKLKEEQEIGMPDGTEVIVRDLFYNTPARLKYMKTIHTEVGHVSDLINRLALSHPDIAFILKHNDKILLKTMGDGSLLHVIAAIYGTSTAKMMVPLENDSIDFTLKGYVARPEITRANRTYVTTIVNGRYIRNYPLIQAVIRGYHTLLPINRYPVSVLHLDMDPVLMDVNVHPSKLEIRFSKEQELLELVEGTVRRALEKQTLIPEPSKQSAAGRTSIKTEKPVQTDLELTRKTRPESASFNFQVKGTKDRPTPKEIETFQKWVQPEPETETTGMIKEDSQSNEWNADFKNPVPDQHPENGEEQTENKMDQAGMAGENSPDRLPVLDPLAQLHGTYILAQHEDGLYIIDQHAAQERIYYEYFLNRLKQDTIESQNLLVPIHLEVTAAESQVIQENLDLLSQVGVHLEPFGSNAYVVRALPRWIPEGEEEAVVREMIQMLVENKKINVVQLREEAAISMSCKAAIKANRYLTRPEMEALLDKLRESSNPFTCPHGRPITIHFSSYEIQKMFKRVM
ncbi:MAG: DNA mismatch repair endonuclease MutL [Bacillaceae bacterium]|nr:DNA mismatch repair endonuclease MutL [Bacillaceae bacterium]